MNIGGIGVSELVILAVFLTCVVTIAVVVGLGAVILFRMKRKE